MSEVFISYARSTEGEARRIADALRAAGYAVWRDDELPAHRSYAAVIEERLKAAKAVVVVWSAEAVKSEWVQSEADRARSEHKLVQLRLDGAALPMPFDRIQCADLANWSGDATAPGWRRVADSVAALVHGGAQVVAPGPAIALPATTERRLAVLAFDNLSPDPEMAFFSDGVSEEIQDTLSRGSELKVIGRTSAFQLRGADKTVHKAAAELKATHVLDGSVRRAGQRVRVTAQLIDCASETTLWSNRFDEELTDVFAVQDEIAAAVAAALKVVFAPAVKSASVDPAAYELFMKARELAFGDLSRDACRSAIELLERATSIAPNFARAWAYLGTMQNRMLRTHGTDEPYAVARDKMIRALDTALALDPGNAAARLALGGILPFGQHAAREARFEAALATSPNDPEIMSDVAVFRLRVGRVRDALDFGRQSFDLDPKHLQMANNYAVILEYAGRHEEGRELWDRLLDVWPQAPVLYNNAIMFSYSTQEWDRVESLARLAKERGVYAGTVRSNVRHSRGLRTRDADYSDHYLRRMRDEVARTGNLREVDYANLCNLGLADEAFELMEQASFDYVTDVEKPRSGSFSSSNILAPAYSLELIRDPRFPRLCQRLGLCDYWVTTGRWPDLAVDGVPPYDFEAECRRLAHPPT